LDERKMKSWVASMLDPKTRQQLVRLLSKTLIFADTTEPFRQAIVKRLIPAEYAPGQAIFEQGVEGDWMAIVLSGRLERHLHRVDHDVSLGGVSPGGVIGDLGMFGVSNTRSFTVTAEIPTTLLILTPAHFEEAVARAGGPKSLALFRDSAEMQNLMADVESFLDLPCFRKLDREFVLRLRNNSEPRLYYPKQVVMKEGAFGEEMYILRCGTVKIEKDGKFVVELPSGTVLGELAVLGSDRRRTATVTATSLCLMRVLHADIFHEILDAFPRAKRMVEHAYMARSSVVQVNQSLSEKAELDAFYGAVHPRKTADVEALVGMEQHKAADLRRTAMMAHKPKNVLPKLCLQDGRIVNVTPRAIHTA